MFTVKNQIKLNLIILVLFILHSLPGCSTLEIGDYLKDNPIIASTSFRYATAKYIQGDQERANQVIERVSKLKAFIIQNPTLTVSGVMQHLDATIQWDKLDIADRLLIKDILMIIEADLSANEANNPLVNIRELLDTVISAALLYSR